MILINPTKQTYEAPVADVVPISTEDCILSGSAIIDDMGDEDMYGVSPLNLSPSADWII